MENRALLLFQIGPVQEFIAQAAQVSDLWAGSYLLSTLIYEGIRKIPDYKEAVVFPNLKTDQVETALKNLIPTIPNRFLAFVPADPEKIQGIIREVDRAIREKLLSLARDLKIEGAETQARQFLSSTWAILKEPTGNMGKDYKALGKKLALRRNLREFTPWRESVEGKQLQKDYLSGKELALQNGLGALNLIKREIFDEYKGSLPSLSRGLSKLKDPYIAVIAMDGDRMGKNLSSFTSEGQHRAFSASLAEFAVSVPQILRDAHQEYQEQIRKEGGEPEKEGESFEGHLIYAGGDDVLAVVAAKEGIACARKLATAFSNKMNFGEIGAADGENRITASVGLAIGHSKVPLQELIHHAHAAEKRAKDEKNGYKRKALAVDIYKRSGEIIQWGCNWNSHALDFFQIIRETHESEAVSGRFPYKLAELLQPYGKLDAAMREVVEVEVNHAWERSSQSQFEKKDDFQNLAKTYLQECVKEDRMNDFLNLFLCETFINRPREENQ